MRPENICKKKEFQEDKTKCEAPTYNMYDPEGYIYSDPEQKICEHKEKNNKCSENLDNKQKYKKYKDNFPEAIETRKEEKQKEINRGEERAKRRIEVKEELEKEGIFLNSKFIEEYIELSNDDKKLLKINYKKMKDIEDPDNSEYQEKFEENGYASKDFVELFMYARNAKNMLDFYSKSEDFREAEATTLARGTVASEFFGSRDGLPRVNSFPSTRGNIEISPADKKKSGAIGQNFRNYFEQTFNSQRDYGEYLTESLVRATQSDNLVTLYFDSLPDSPESLVRNHLLENDEEGVQVGLILSYCPPDECKEASVRKIIVPKGEDDDTLNRQIKTGIETAAGGGNSLSDEYKFVTGNRVFIKTDKENIYFDIKDTDNKKALAQISRALHFLIGSRDDEEGGALKGQDILDFQTFYNGAIENARILKFPSGTDFEMVKFALQKKFSTKNPIEKWEKVVKSELLRLQVLNGDLKKLDAQMVNLVLSKKNDREKKTTLENLVNFFEWFTTEYDKLKRRATQTLNTEKTKVTDKARILPHLKNATGIKLEESDYLPLSKSLIKRLDDAQNSGTSLSLIELRDEIEGCKSKDNGNDIKNCILAYIDNLKNLSGGLLKLRGEIEADLSEDCKNETDEEKVQVCILDYINTLKRNSDLPPRVPEPDFSDDSESDSSDDFPPAPAEPLLEEVQRLKDDLEKQKRKFDVTKSQIIKGKDKKYANLENFANRVKERLQKIKDAKDIECTTPGVDDTTCILDFIDNLDTTAPPPSSSTTTTTPTTAATPPPTVTVTPSRPQPNLRALKNVMVWDTVSLLNMAGRKVEVTPTWSRPYI